MPQLLPWTSSKLHELRVLVVGFVIIINPRHRNISSATSMRFRTASLALLFAAATTTRSSRAFLVGPLRAGPAAPTSTAARRPTLLSSPQQPARHPRRSLFASSSSSAGGSRLRAASSSAGAATIFEGEPTERARSTVDPRQVVRARPVTSIRGQEVRFDDLIGTPDDPDDGTTSIVVFLRSLG